MTKSYAKKVAVNYANQAWCPRPKATPKKCSEVCQSSQAAVTTKKVAVTYANQGKQPRPKATPKKKQSVMPIRVSSLDEKLHQKSSS